MRNLLKYIPFLTFLFTPKVFAQECGVASFYHDYYHGRKTSSGSIFKQNSNQAAHKYLRFGTKLRVTSGGKSTIVRITDRGPFIPGRIIDLSKSSFANLSTLGRGVIPVCIQVLTR